MLDYGILHEGSYFGDISIILDEPNEYSYQFDPYLIEKPLQLLSIESKTFLQILEKYPLSKEVFLKRATRRKQQFASYKTLEILKMMKSAR